MEKILNYVLMFFFYSAAGWLIESIYCSIGEKRWINRGFLTGPMCPIYGTGATVLTVCIYNPFKDNPLMVFLLGIILCDIVEYLTSLIMEKLFKARWWDYTHEFLNIKGRICIKHSLYWGIASVSFVELIHPKVEALFSKFDPTVMNYIRIIVLVIFVIDVINAVRKAMDIRKLQVKLNNLIESITSGFNNVTTTINDKLHEKIIGDKSEQAIKERSEISEQIQDVLQQFELRFKRKTKAEPNKFFNRLYYNNPTLERYSRKQIDNLKKLRDDIKANLFENDEMQ